MNAEELREGIFNLNTRRFGKVAEVMIKRLYKLNEPSSLFHDLYDDMQKHRVEVKFSTVRKKNSRAITVDNVLQCIEDEVSSNRMVLFNEWKISKFDCNIQQVKRAEFDVLYYGCFFADRILIFKIASQDIGSQIYYSDKQHKGNVGEGQFHLNNKTLKIHLDRYLFLELTYEELRKLLTEESHLP